MRLFNAIATYDIYIVAESNETARETLIAWIAEGAVPSEAIAFETTREGAIRDAWREQKPLVATDVSDADFVRLEGKTTIGIFEHIYTKRT
jgi:hypothetical protein